MSDSHLPIRYVGVRRLVLGAGVLVVALGFVSVLGVRAARSGDTEAREEAVDPVATAAEPTDAARLAASREAAQPTAMRVSSSHVVIDPGVARLTPEERLTRGVRSGNVRGAVRGRAGVPTAPWHNVAGTSQAAQDLPFSVGAFLGAGPPPYAVGATITLRIPVVSGVIATASAGAPALEFRVSDVYPPSVTAGQELYVLMRDQGGYLGGSAHDRIIASAPTDVFTIEGGLVRGQGQWATIVETRAAFERRFHQP